MKAILVIELNITDPEQVTKAIKAIKPPSIPYFAGTIRVSVDGFNDESPATAILNYLDGEGEV